MVTKRDFGTLDGQTIPVLTLTEGPCSVELIPFGAAIRSIVVPDRHGNPTDICLGYDDPDSYRTLDACLGGTIGRCANRIGGASFSIDGTAYHLTANEGANTLHGGSIGFHKRMWDYRCEEHSVVFSLDSPDGEEGFPGNVHAEVTYTLLDRVLTVAYRAVSDRDTVVNLTNHAYFNLAGHDGGEVRDHRVTIHADRFTPSDSGNIPTGELLPVADTPLDLRSSAELGACLNDPFFAPTRGFDHNYVLNHGEWAAEVTCPRTGITLELGTTLPGMQVYSSGFLTDRIGKEGKTYGQTHGLCLEPQFFPDAVHHTAFPSPVLRAGEEFQHSIRYRFSAK